MIPRPTACVYSPRPLSTRSDAFAVAREFGGLIRHVLCSTVTRTPTRLLPVESPTDWRQTEWIVSALDDRRGSVPLQLVDRTWLLVQQRLGVREKAGEWWLTTLEHAYRWQATPDDKSWLIGWHYMREAPDYPRSHIHVNCAPGSYPAGRKHFGKLHLPTRRLPLEDVLAFLINECGVPHISPNWRNILDEAARIFEQIQADRIAADYG
jgi:hypothetical protein